MLVAGVPARVIGARRVRDSSPRAKITQSDRFG